MVGVGDDEDGGVAEPVEDEGGDLLVVTGIRGGDGLLDAFGVGLAGGGHRDNGLGGGGVHAGGIGAFLQDDGAFVGGGGGVEHGHGLDVADADHVHVGAFGDSGSGVGSLLVHQFG